MQALLGPGTAGVHMEFLQVTDDWIISPVLLSLTRKPKVPVKVLSSYILDTSHHMLIGASVVVVAVGTASWRPLATQSATTQTYITEEPFENL